MIFGFWNLCLLDEILARLMDALRLMGVGKDKVGVVGGLVSSRMRF